jgi:epimerase transport system membrane fusion protein
MKANDTQMRSPGMPDINDAKYIKIGLSVVFTIFVVIGVWSAFAELDSGVPCPGQVVVESNKKVIQHLEGGIIQNIYAKDGDVVKEGEILIKFDDIKSESELNSMLANFYETIALRDRLVSENTRQNSITFSKELDELDETKKKQIQDRQIDTFENETGYLKKQETVTIQKIDSLTNQIESLKQSIEMQKTLLESYQEEAQEQEKLLEKGLVDKVKYRDAIRRVNMINSDILSAQTEIEKDSSLIESIKTQFQVDKEKFFTDLNTQLSKAESSIEDMKARIVNLKDRLSKTIIKSPVEGTVMNSAYHTIGAVVSPGNPIMDIVPNDSTLIIDAKLSPEYIDFVKVGYKANMTFPSFQMKGSFIENIEGEVIFVAADSITDKNGNSFYQIKLKIDSDGEKTLQKSGLILLAGMPASITVKSGKQTLLEYLLKPMSMMLDRAFLEQ